nr:cation:dicarboxylase symporter family transporter [Pectobacterium colocasium]
MVFAATVATVGNLPIEGLALIFGVYRFMSMAIALCNTIGNSVATIIVAKWCGEYSPQPDNALANTRLTQETRPAR